MLTSDGRRLLVGWMGVPEGEEMLQPTLTNGWIHQMTCLRELEFIDGQLYQRPLRELSALRGEAHGWAGNSLPLAPMEIVLQTTGDDILSLDFDGALTLERDASGIRLARPSLASDEKHYRYWRGDVRSLHIFIDQSSVEIFINGGEGVMSCRYFPACSGQLMFSGITPDAFCYWPLRTCMVEAGVSKATASLVLNGRGKELRVAQETRERVLAIAREQHYQPSIHARSLRDNRSHTIGLVVPEITNHGFAVFSHELEMLCREAGVQLLISCTDENPGQESVVVNNMISRQVDGLIVASCMHNDADYLK